MFATNITLLRSGLVGKDHFSYKDVRANAPFVIGRDRIGYKDCRASAPKLLKCSMPTKMKV